MPTRDDSRGWNTRPAARIFLKTATLGVRRIALLILFAGILPALPEQALGNLFVAVPGSFLGPGYIGEYTNSGATINASLITGLTDITQIAVADGFIYIANRSGTIGKYTTSGETINASLISGLGDLRDIEVLGSDLYVLEDRGGLFHPTRVGKYTTSGETVNASLITGVFGDGFAISGTDLFVENRFGVGHYTTSGATINASFLTDDFFQEGVWDLEVSASNLYAIYNYGDDTRLAKYDLSGTLLNPDLTNATGSVLAISGNDLFMNLGRTVGKFDRSGELITYPLIPLQNNGVSGIAVDGSATIPDVGSTGLLFSFALAALGIYASARHQAPQSA